MITKIIRNVLNVDLKLVYTKVILVGKIMKHRVSWLIRFRGVFFVSV